MESGSIYWGISIEYNEIHNHLRYISMARGAVAPPKLPTLASQLILGSSKAQRNPVKEVNTKSKRAITLEILRLLENSIARREDWSLFEKV